MSQGHGPHVLTHLRGQGGVVTEGYPGHQGIGAFRKQRPPRTAHTRVTIVRRFTAHGLYQPGPNLRHHPQHSPAGVQQARLTTVEKCTVAATVLTCTRQRMQAHAVTQLQLRPRLPTKHERAGPRLFPVHSFDGERQRPVFAPPASSAGARTGGNRPNQRDRLPLGDGSAERIRLPSL